MFREGGHSTAVVSGGRRKVQTVFDDGSELVEEYDARSGELLVRKRRAKTPLGGMGEWEVLVGHADPAAGAGATARWNPESGTLRPNANNPEFSRKDTRDAFQWRVRNLPYPPDTYDVSIDAPARQIVIRTSNKKYFKRISVPELELVGLPLAAAALTWSHAHATLVVSYAKPAQVLAQEAREAEETRKLRPQEVPVEGNPECKQQ